MENEIETIKPEPRTFKWYEAAVEIIYQCKLETIVEILADPRASVKRAFRWLILVGLMAGALSGIIHGIIGQNLSLPMVLVTSILTPVEDIVFFPVFTSLILFFSSKMGGQGTFSRLFYILVVIEIPFYFIRLILHFVSENSIFSWPAIIYSIILDIQAIRVEENLQTGKAIAACLLSFAICVIAAVGIIYFYRLFFVAKTP